MPRKRQHSTCWLFDQKLGDKFKDKTSTLEFKVWSTSLCGTANWTVPKVDQKYLEGFEMWCCRRIDLISWTDRVKNEDVLQRIAENKNILHTIKQKKPTWTRHQFMTLNQQNAQTFFLDMYVTILHWIFLYVSIRKRPLSRNQFKEISHNATLTRSSHGVKVSRCLKG